MIYYYDSSQLREINKNTFKLIKNLTNASDYDKIVKEYKKEERYWTEEYPTQLLQWVDDGGQNFE